jgi:hypothetical protein
MVIRRGRSFTGVLGSFLGWSHTFSIAVVATILLAISTYSESFESARLTVLLLVLLFVHSIRFPRLMLSREVSFYAFFVAYNCIEMLWTQDRSLAMNTLVPALNFLLILVLYSSLAAYHSLHATLAGSLAGLVIGAALYTLTVGFPLNVPPNFSYNAIAGMYLFGLVVAVMISSLTGSRWLLLPIQVLLMMMVVATTSIKTNLGVLLGVTASACVYFKRFVRVLGRNIILLAALAGLLTYLVLSNEQVSGILERGFSRVSVGLEVLQSREDRPGYSGFNYRTAWEREGLSGWVQNPIFGYGVEAFRAEVGITSHSTPIDLLYNSGLIGFLLFYSLFFLVLRRLYRLRHADIGSMGTVIFGALVCYGFITLSATMHYNSFLGAFFALSSQILEGFARRRADAPRA